MSDAIKKRKTKVLRSEGGTPETKRGRGEGDQPVCVKHGLLCALSSYSKVQTDLLSVDAIAKTHFLCIAKCADYQAVQSNTRHPLRPKSVFMAQANIKIK